jgi:cytochrome b subunit of formate dehydrogenase
MKLVQSEISNKKFGLSVGAVFFLLGAIPSIFGEPSIFKIIFLIIGVLLISGALIRPASLQVLNNVWMAFGYAVQRFTNPVVMFLMYHFLFVPLGFLMKLFGYNPLKKEFDQNSNSYWIEREASSISEESLKNQF